MAGDCADFTDNYAAREEIIIIMQYLTACGTPKATVKKMDHPNRM